MSDEQVKGIPADLRELYDAMEDNIFMRVYNDASTIRLLIERIARSEQQLHGCELAARDYTEAAKYGAEIGFGDEMKAVLICRESLDAAIARYLSAEQALAALEARNRELSAPVSEEELIREVPLLEQGDPLANWNNGLRQRLRGAINRTLAARAALKGAS